MCPLILSPSTTTTFIVIYQVGIVYFLSDMGTDQSECVLCLKCAIHRLPCLPCLAIIVKVMSTAYALYPLVTQFL